jgi:uncharacterized protein YgbK (DUF1537 family)
MIGVIADDVTGATDVAAALKRSGLRTLLTFGVPENLDASSDALVVALKSRNLEAGKAIDQSLAALDRLRNAGADRFYFKYCSTFDSTDRGNIGPVTEALADQLGVPMVVTTPSSPEHGRTVYRGHLFVGDTLLAESPMRDHPLSPMTDSSVVRLLAAQSKGDIGLLNLDTVRAGVVSVREAVDTMRRSGVRQLVADATSTEDLLVLGQACADSPLTAGAMGLMSGIASSDATPHVTSPVVPSAEPWAPTVLIAGSCSARTLEQIECYQERRSEHSYRLDSAAHSDAASMGAAALAWYDDHGRDSVPLIYSSLPPARLKEVQARLGTDVAGALFEQAAAIIARGLIERGVTRLITAGGETSGAVMDALGVTTAEIGDEAATGVPWLHCRDRTRSLALKSGNFGEPDFLDSLASDHERALTGRIE